MASSRAGLGLFLLPVCLFARPEAPENRRVTIKRLDE